jgi:hypothetical protein
VAVTLTCDDTRSVDGNHKAAARLSELLIKLRAEQDAALKGRYNLWQYGDIGDGDDPEL